MSDWHYDVPKGTEEMWDIVAKALLMRTGGSAVISADEMRMAANVPAVMRLGGDGTVEFKLEGQLVQ